MDIMERMLRLLFSALEVLALRRMQRLRANAGGASTFSRRRTLMAIQAYFKILLEL
ncbi:MAG: hypothetical protein FGF50_11475 [Candidatus Brockarchaeota archaeon]|nr:hypothetical protein [Candidatus Brockarchaeota archaeon]